MKVGVVDYGVGNLGSVCRALEELRATPVLVDRAVDLHAADCLLLPGVGNFTDCMTLLHAGGWVAALQDEVLARRRPLLGVCVGMQMLASRSMEGSSPGSADGTAGLGFVPGTVRHLRELGCAERVPHVGWNAVAVGRERRGLFEGIPDATDFYFVHSYAFVADDAQHVAARTHHGVPLTAAVHAGHVWGTQFHPEKSSRAGLRLLRNFIQGPGC